ncbi:MAG: hypothetical protein WCS37_00265 [Chloroflexota bacterium]|nr:hypothetical protein [Chloroflexota bacterium]
MDLVMLLAVVLFAGLVLCWLFLPHTKELSETSLEFSQIADEAQLAHVR